MHAPGKIMLNRFVTLARRTAEQLQGLVASPLGKPERRTARWNALFAAPPVDSFDVVVHLRDTAELLQALTYVLVSTLLSRVGSHQLIFCVSRCTNVS